MESGSGGKGGKKKEPIELSNYCFKDVKYVNL